MAFPRKLKELCTPAFIYFILSVIGILATSISNLGNSNIYTLGNFSSPVPNTLLVFIVKIIYVLFWTWILNLMCKDGHKEIAWFLVLLPFVLFFIILLMMKRTGFEGFQTADEEVPTCDSLDATLKTCTGDNIWLENEESMYNDQKCRGKCGPPPSTEGFTTKKTHMSYGLPVPNGY
jgi:hypothetical protein